MVMTRETFPVSSSKERFYRVAPLFFHRFCFSRQNIRATFIVIGLVNHFL